MKMSLRDYILSDTNIYNAIYALNSYISERNLLSEEDTILLSRLSDKFDFDGVVKDVVNKCKKKLDEILNTDKLFKTNVYFKLKKFDDKKRSIVYRPLHTACLTDQICMAAMLIPLMFDDSEGKRKYSELSKMLPHNFYGNIPSENVDSLFMYWPQKYRQYSNIVNEKCKEYSKTHEYDKMINFDLKDFFPSVNPAFIYDFIIKRLHNNYNAKNLDTLKIVVAKLLYFRIPKSNLNGWTDAYYPNIKDGNYPRISVNRGIAQGLPQSYFFGNLCMIQVAEMMHTLPKLKDSEAYFYVDDSVVFAKGIQEIDFDGILVDLNAAVKRMTDRLEYKPDKLLPTVYNKEQKKISYQILFHTEGKSTICGIDESLNGLEYLFLVQRPLSLGGWIKGNIDEVDDHVSLKKLNILQRIVDAEIKKVKAESAVHQKGSKWQKTRLKWLDRYRKYFIIRYRKLKMIVDGKFESSMIEDFYKDFKIDELLDKGKQEGHNDVWTDDDVIDIFNKFEEDIFSAEIELLAKGMPFNEVDQFCNKIQMFEASLSCHNSNKYNTKYLYFHKIAENFKKQISTDTDRYSSLCRRIRRINTYKSSKVLLLDLKKDNDITEIGFWNKINKFHDKSNQINFWTLLPNFTKFVFDNSNEFKRMILNCYFSVACNIPVGDNMMLLRRDIKPVKYYEMRILTILRNRRCRNGQFFEFLRTLDYDDLNERMDIDLGIMEAIGIFILKIQDPMKIDRMILTHRLVKSLWHNGSKFLNAYTLHNQEHALNLIKNVVRLTNNVDYLNLKSNDYFLLFQACYLHDISMVIHPNIASFNESSPEAEQMVSDWIFKIEGISEKINAALKDNHFSLEGINLIRKEIGGALIEAFRGVFDFFENKVRYSHAYDSAGYIRKWQTGILSFISELEAECIATVSESHGWDSIDVYSLKSSAKEELVSLKYMMILIRMADLLDLANDRIDYYILKQNRSQMSLESRFHWISHLITDGFKLDADYESRYFKDNEDSVSEDYKLNNHPITEKLHLDIFLNTEILASLQMSKDPCEGICPSIKKRKRNSNPADHTEALCLEYEVSKDGEICHSNLCKANADGTRDCPFLCVWMAKRHKWLFSEIAELKSYLNAVNSELFETEFVVRFFYANSRKLDSEFYDDIKENIS